MSDTPDGPARDDMRKHLDFIQGAITRLAGNSFVIKGWALTVSAAIYSFAANDRDWRVALIGVLPGAVFWGLDAYYLRRERQFRELYDDARCGRVDLYVMDPRPYEARVPVPEVLWSTTLKVFYGVIVAFGPLLALSLVLG